MFKGQILFIKEKNKTKRESISKLIFNNELIIEKSKKNFNEPNPCPIYESYCIAEIQNELLEYLNFNIEKYKEKEFGLTEILNDEKLKNIISKENFNNYIKIKFL